MLISVWELEFRRFSCPLLYWGIIPSCRASEVSCYLVEIEAWQQFLGDNEVDCYLVVFQASQRLTEGIRLNCCLVELQALQFLKLLSGRDPGFNIFNWNIN